MSNQKKTQTTKDGNKKEIIKKNKTSFLDTVKNAVSRGKDKKTVKSSSGNLSLLESDLIKGEVPIKFNLERHLVSFLVLLLVSFVLIMEIFFFLSWWEKNKNPENFMYLQREMASIDKSMRELESSYEEVFQFRNKINTSFYVLDNHIYWTNFFSFLEQNTLKDVYYKNFSGGIDGIYTLNSITRDITAVSLQSKYFSEDPFSVSVVTNNEVIGDEGISMGSGHVEFDINLNVNTDIFTKF